MSDTAFTRLQDLAELGYVISQGSGDLMILNHMGDGPRIVLHRDGSIQGWGALLWARHLPYADVIEARDAALFGVWCFQITQPSRRSRLRHHASGISNAVFDTGDHH